jgi:(Z)-2-((N-methylformamido)methylene)-5-hydroxybutyrolactone dehydrogenase
MTTQRAAAGNGPGIPHYPLVIDGRRVESGSGRSYQTLDPFRQSAWATVADGDADDVGLAVAAARRALSGPWGKLTGFGRAQLIRHRARSDT